MITYVKWIEPCLSIIYLLSALFIFKESNKNNPYKIIRGSLCSILAVSFLTLAIIPYNYISIVEPVSIVAIVGIMAQIIIEIPDAKYSCKRTNFEMKFIKFIIAKFKQTSIGK